MKKIAFFGLLIIIALNIFSCGQRKSAMDKVFVKIPEDPTVTFRISFKVGSQNDPFGKEGLAMLTGMLLAEGATTKYSYEEILDLLYPMASAYDVKVDKELTTIFGRTHIDNVDKFMELLLDAITRPAFKEEDFQRIKTNLINYVDKELRYSDDEELGKAGLYEFIFDGTPYRHISYGTLEGLKSITIDDVKEFYKKHFTKENVIIGIGGNFSQELATKLENQLAENLPSLPKEKSPEINPKPIDGYQFLLIEKDCNATAISFGFPIDVVRGQEDFFALWLFRSWFGEHRNSSSHLYQVIREQRGLNYGDYAYIEAFLNGGRLRFPEPNNPRRKQIFEVWIRPVQHENRLFALRAALHELKKVVDNGLTQEDFETTKKFLLNYCLFYAPTTSAKLGYQIDNHFYGFNDGGNYIEFLRKKLNELTLEQVNKAIKKHIQYNNIKFCLVTKDAEKLKEELINNAPSPITYSTPKPNEVLEEDKLIATFLLKVKPENIRIVNIENMFVK